FISEAALESTIKAVRQAIGDSGRGQQLLQTVYGHGYRFIAAVQAHADATPGTADEGSPAPHDLESVQASALHDMACIPLKQEAAEDNRSHGTRPAPVEAGLRSRDTSTPAGGNNTLPMVETLGPPGRGEDVPAPTQSRRRVQLARRSTPAGEYKPVTVLCCALAKPTALATRVGPEAMHHMMQALF